MAWSTPRTWGASDVATAAQFNANIRDNFDYLYGNWYPADGTYPANVGRVAGAWTLSSLSLPYNTVTVPTWDIERYDPTNVVVTPWTTMTPPAGVYLIALSINPSNYGQFRAAIRRNATVYTGAVGCWNGESGGLVPIVSAHALFQTNGAQTFGSDFYSRSPAGTVSVGGQYQIAGVR